jgi:xanthine dehydrogenase small subunit
VVTLDRFDPTLTLLDYLRIHERAVGTKEGCNEGDCGACTVVLRRVKNGGVVHQPVNACILLAGMAHGAEVVTVEDIAPAGALHPVQAAMVQHHGSQCGFCTPGIVMSLYALHESGERPVTRAAINDQLAGNLCRCTGYRPIVDAALQACAEPTQTSPLDTLATMQALLELADGEDVFVGDETRFFAAPATREALAALYARHPDATLVAGATDVGLWITKQMRPITKLIWLGRVAGLAEVDDSAEALVLGAGVSHSDALPLLASIDPDLGEIMRRFGSAQVRTSGTVGGNIANGSPIGDLAPALIALGATLTLQRAGDGENGDNGALVSRNMPLEAFFLAYGRQDRQPGEFVAALTIPRLAKAEHVRATKISKRFDEDISTVMMALKLRLDGRRIAEARLAFGGMAATPKRAPATEAALTGLSLDDRTGWMAAVSTLATDFTPIDDQRASAHYRRRVAEAAVRKALMEMADSSTQATRLAPREAAHAA